MDKLTTQELKDLMWVIRGFGSMQDTFTKLNDELLKRGGK